MKLHLLTLTAVAALATAASADEVRVYNWSDYIDEELLAKFEAETGLDLVYDVFDSNELLETKMLAGGSGYDVVVPTYKMIMNSTNSARDQKLKQNLKFYQTRNEIVSTVHNQLDF